MSGQDWIASFDSLFTNNQIQKLKILLPCLNRPLQGNLAVCIKYLELRHTMTLFKNHPENTASALPHSSAGPGELCETLLPFCTVSERNSLSSLRNMLQTFEQYKEMMEMMAMMQELFPQGAGDQETPDFISSDADSADTGLGADENTGSGSGHDTGSCSGHGAGMAGTGMDGSISNIMQMLNLFQAMNTPSEISEAERCSSSSSDDSHTT